jgi:SprT protein
MSSQRSLATQRLPIALQQAAMRCLRNKLLLANQRLNSHSPEPVIRYQLKGTSAGSAWLKQWEIRLNPVLLIENGEPFIDTVVPHELAHLLVYQHFGRVAPHGREWCWMMETILDEPAQRTHRFDILSVQGATFAYRCGCQTHQLTLRRHHRVTRGQNEYRCRQCGEILQQLNLNVPLE